MASTRRLAAILAADVAGYSRLMGADEEGTHERLKAHLRKLVDPKIEEHRGRIVKNTGDGMLAEFASVVDAVRCAVEVQRGMIEREPEVPEDKRIRFRIGVNLGDVIVEEHDIFGDGVNIAARLEALAEPGGICISGTVFDHIGDRLPHAFWDMGEQSVKNIPRRVRVYALRPEVIAELPASSAPPENAVPQPAIAQRLSIVVLPFANLSNDPEQQYFADGITEDLTSDLSRIAHSFVISCNTAFTYRNKRIDTKQIGRELGVRYVLEGSVRRLGNQIRINAQLIDAERDAHLWAERFNGDTSDLFALQDEITSRIAVALNLELIGVEAARPNEHPDALDYILRARALMKKPHSREIRSEQINLYERALTLDPDSVEAQGRMAVALAGRILANMTDTVEADVFRAEDLAARAMAGSPNSPLPHYAKGNVLRARGRFAEAIFEYETMLALDRNWVSGFFALGQCKLFTGSIEETIPLVEQAIRLSPRDPELGVWYSNIGLVHLLRLRMVEAIIWLEKARNHTPARSLIRAQLASAYGLHGESERATAELVQARKLSSDDRFSSLARLKAAGLTGSGSWGVPELLELLEATYFAGLRLAGMPEE
jgi:TolB-like protein/class 3 adenylate cyclase/Flp pilus assembly protein TadD